MRTTTLVLGLIAATLLLFGGCAGYVVGGIGTAVEDAFELETETEGVTSTTEDVSGAGAFAMIVAIFLFVAAGLAKVALRTSLLLLTIAIPMLIGLVAVDTTSLFAVVYYLGIVLIGTCCILMLIAWRREAKGVTTGE